MMNKKMKILLAMGAMAAVVLASGCGGDAKSGVDVIVHLLGG